jgi:hypothetical protein
MEVRKPLYRLLWPLLTNLLGLCAFKLIDCGGGYFHHIRTRFEEENENMGPYD